MSAPLARLSFALYANGVLYTKPLIVRLAWIILFKEIIFRLSFFCLNFTFRRFYSRIYLPYFYLRFLYFYLYFCFCRKSPFLLRIFDFTARGLREIYFIARHLLITLLNPHEFVFHTLTFFRRLLDETATSGCFRVCANSALCFLPFGQNATFKPF